MGLLLKVAVIGTVFVDCKGFAANRYVALGRNVGSVKFVHGGVGRNVAENLSRLGIPVCLVSSVDNGPIGSAVVDRLSCLGIDNNYLARLDSCGMGMWLAILDERGELAGSISQMPDLRGMENMIALRGEELMDCCSHIALELDLNETITRRVLALARQKKRPVYGLPGNLEIICAAPDVLKGLACFICNQIELGRLCGREFAETDIEGVKGYLPQFAEQFGLQSAVVTLGAQGSVWFDRERQEAGYQQACKVTVVDTCGAGDAFFSGTMAGLVQGEGLEKAAEQGTRVAACTIQSAENNCLTLAESLQNMP